MWVNCICSQFFLGLALLAWTNLVRKTKHASCMYCARGRGVWATAVSSAAWTTRQVCAVNSTHQMAQCRRLISPGFAIGAELPLTAHGFAYVTVTNTFFTRTVASRCMTVPPASACDIDEIEGAAPPHGLSSTYDFR